MPTFLWMLGAVAPFASPLYTPLGTVWWATFRKLESRMSKSGYVNHVRN